MSRNWRTLCRAVLAVVLVASLTIVLAHWHRDFAGQDCGICSVRHMPVLENTAGNTLVISISQEGTYFSAETAPIFSRFSRVQQGRAPPQVFVSL